METATLLAGPSRSTTPAPTSSRERAALDCNRSIAATAAGQWLGAHRRIALNLHSVPPGKAGMTADDA